MAQPISEQYGVFRQKPDMLNGINDLTKLNFRFKGFGEFSKDRKQKVTEYRSGSRS